MTDYIIATSSTSDLPRSWLDAHQIPFISYTYTVNGALCEDDCREERREKIYIGMRNGDQLKASMINEFVYFIDDYRLHSRWQIPKGKETRGIRSGKKRRMS